MDYSTAMLLWATEASTLAILMIGAWIFDRRQAVTGVWGLGFALHGIGIALIGLRGVIPDLLSILGGNGLMLLGVASWCNGILLYDRQRFSIVTLLPIVAWLSALAFPSVMEDFWKRSVAVQLAAGSAYLMLACLLAARLGASRSVRQAFAVMMTLQACLMFKMAYDCFDTRPSSFLEMPNLETFAIGNIFCLVAGILLGARLLMARSEARLQRLAESDPLTGTLNRRGLLDRFNTTTRRAIADRQQISIVLFDLDHFKLINDRHGHKAGDIVLMEFCRIARACLGERGIFGRMGGEEFACVVPVDSAAEATGIAEAIRLTLHHSAINLGQADVTATVSCGIALLPAASADLDQMLISADRALYAAKSGGRNRTALIGAAQDDIQFIGHPPTEIDAREEADEALAFVWQRQPAAPYASARA